MALGSHETTLLQITNAYSSIANGGVMMTPKLIQSIYNRQGNLIYASKDTFCDNCKYNDTSQKSTPRIGVFGKVMTDSATNYQMLSLLEGSVERGSSRGAKRFNKTIAGKTGTTNDSFDTWFIGMTSEVTVGVYVGYDTPRTLGKNASGSNLALPIFNDFLEHAKNLPCSPFLKPETIVERFTMLEEGSIVSDAEGAGMVKTRKVIKEAFKKSSQ